jgi:hypothetical protein
MAMPLTWQISGLKRGQDPHGLADRFLARLDDGHALPFTVAATFVHGHKPGDRGNHGEILHHPAALP